MHCICREASPDSFVAPEYRRGKGGSAVDIVAASEGFFDHASATGSVFAD
jgi:hypothetical protein